MNIVTTKTIKKDNYEAAQVLLAATVNFLLGNEIPETVIRSFMLKRGYRSKSKTRLRKFGAVIKAYEDMGMIMSTWFTNTEFLDALGQPSAAESRPRTQVIPNTRPPIASKYISKRGNRIITAIFKRSH